MKTHQNNTQSVETILNDLVQATHNSTFNGTEFTEESCRQFQVITKDQYKRDENKIAKNNSTKSFTELIDFMWKLKRMTDTASADYNEWTGTVRAIAYSSAYGVTVGMMVADILGCLGNYFMFVCFIVFYKGVYFPFLASTMPYKSNPYLQSSL